MIREYLKNNILITDGAMGTYYAQITGKYNVFPEFANINEPEIIERIHTEYINAGAKLIKTNTFSANSRVLKIPKSEVKKIVLAGLDLANKVAQGKSIFIAASIGPIPEMFDKMETDQENSLDEYKFIVDIFLNSDIKIFMFETFSDVSDLLEITKYIKVKDSSAFIVTQFATTPEGFTRKGLSNKHIIAEVKKSKSIDAYGFNCGVGPTHLFNSLKKLNFADDMVAAAPNAGYPEIVHERMVYIQNPNYFAEKMKDISGLGVKILGGCCGTTPIHIEKMSELIQSYLNAPIPKQQISAKPKVIIDREKTDGFFEKMRKGKFVIAVELDPPFNADTDLILQNAWICKDHGVDAITIADSPMARARADSIMIAAKIKREVGIEVLPHLCCRDKNLNALKSALLAGYIENIRNVLAITGDPVAIADKNDIKGVFNLNSMKLIQLISTMNKELFPEDPINVGGALNLNLLKPEAELAKMVKKINSGATFFLTQPIFEDYVINILRLINKNDGIKILGGIMPLVSYKNALFLNNEVAGIKIPERIINKYNSNMGKDEAEIIGIEIAVEIANKIKESVDGFYFITPFNRVEMIMKIIKKLKCFH
ncbi:methylenetetrahydrofolate reductase [Desulforamulus reducens MI-1]|uniref:Methylenetetrahydrofolate reductase n=1 Tax=Desulforamulus reducens (strain ATCC BAA-1160 / DSM 100696 / MI-1) TaxID=349161 RepID=A4J5C2_DESRM|nr:bifunctional homocysteine S-methyltransferase/methylenetetrahydrofolate reductase [Desulforamulus reducens]ABO50275.1 methylenetetrahydrofolate reductase [Desulforamulus reducens MI-1]